MNSMEKIVMYCDMIKTVAKYAKEMTLLDLARCEAEFKTLAQLFQTTFDRLQEEQGREKVNEKI